MKRLSLIHVYDALISEDFKADIETIYRWYAENIMPNLIVRVGDDLYLNKSELHTVAPRLALEDLESPSFLENIFEPDET
jgi:hypothetical protein